MSNKKFRRLQKELNREDDAASTLILWVVTAFILLMGIWAVNTEIDNVTRGQGKIISQGKNIIIQAQQNGVSKSVYVRENDIVNKGDLLFEIDPVETVARLEQAKKKLQALSIRMQRLEAERDGRRFEIQTTLDPETEYVYETELALYLSKKKDYENTVRLLERQIERLESEIEGLNISISLERQQQSLISAELVNLEPLVKAGLAAESKLFQVQKELQTSNSKVESLNKAIEGKRIQISEIVETITSEQQRLQTDTLNELANISADVLDYQTSIPALEEQVSRTKILSTVPGIVKAVKFRNPGSYVRAGDVLMEVVPTDGDLLVLAQIQAKDIGDIKLGDNVKVSVTAFDPIRYGRLNGEVLSIAADANSDERTGAQYYEIEVSMMDNLYEDDGTKVDILPGMVTTIDVVTGKKTIFDYLWAPVTRVKDSAFRD